VVSVLLAPAYAVMGFLGRFIAPYQVAPLGGLY
jgi:hypothetical protein